MMWLHYRKHYQKEEAKKILISNDRIFFASFFECVYFGI